MELDQVLRYENGQKLFMEFLRKEFSEENLEFWLECQRLKNISDVKLVCTIFIAIVFYYFNCFSSD